MKKIMSIMTLAVALFLTACSQQEKATQTSSKQLSRTGRGKYDPLSCDGSKRHVYGARC
mgnify:CR=1 FL=1